MALNASEIATLKPLVDGLRELRQRRPRVLLLGYPDLLLTESSLAMAGVNLSWDSLPKLPAERSATIWREHGFSQLSERPMVDARSIFNQMGADVFVVDFVRWGGEDLILDLNEPVSLSKRWCIGKADLIVDPGTVEHCFNVAQAFDNIDRLLAPGGLVFHQAAAAFPNHGFWSISPTTFFDFYQSRGYELGYPKQVDRVLDDDGFVISMKNLDPFAPISNASGPLTVRYAFRKLPRRVRPAKRYPTQRCYSPLPKTIVMSDLLSGPSQPDALKT
jgi:SAM-dependent methyltransferase